MEAGEGEFPRGRERHVETPTILINPVPGAQSRSRRSNRVHDLQGIYIRSSTRGYNSIPSLYSALEEPFNQGARCGPRIHDAHIILARTLPSSASWSSSSSSSSSPSRVLHHSRSYAFLISLRIEDSSLIAALAPRQDLVGLILSFVRHVTYRRRRKRRRRRRRKKERKRERERKRSLLFLSFMRRFLVLRRWCAENAEVRTREQFTSCE